MISSLPLFHRIAGKPVIVVGDGEAADAKRRLVERAGGISVGEDDPAARLGFVALDAPEDAAVRLRARGVLVNVVDRPELCDFTVPSVLDRAPVLVAIGTAGASAGLAKALRLRLELLLPANLGALARALFEARPALRQRWPKAEVRRLALDAALSTGGALDPLREDSAKAVSAWLETGEAGRPDCAEFVVSTADPDDLTLRQARWLGSADVVAFEPGVPAAVLDRARADAVHQPIAAGEPAPVHTGFAVIIRAG